MNIIDNLIIEFSVEQLRQFFRKKISNFKPKDENYDFLFEDKKEISDNFTDITNIGEAVLNNNDDLLVITAKTNKILTNRTGKKRQYEIAKSILKEENNDAAFFIFYDESNNFRFSFIRANFLGSKRDFTNFKRYTYFVSKEQTNKTFISQISKADFNDLDSIQEAFNVEPLTKQFYEKLQHWYFWAIENVKFPEDAEEEKNGKEIAIIRLITRLIFIWFMKVRKLVPENLFDEENIKNILADFADEDSTYYKAILQNLFFATLNTKQADRKFRSEERYKKGYNPDFGNQNVFRYHDLFKDPESLKTLFEKIPFLNGGLFECLDYRPRGNKRDEKKYIDGFTATKRQQPIVPNFLFFSEPQKKDISKFYGKKNKTYEVEGLINLLKSYNFTIDENEADDIEVALDPELLGSIFENLLASYNPETATTARKATGSFYTPREIVNYMTNESLKQYFLTHLNNTEQLDADLDNLIKSQTNENPFDEMTSKKITKLINDLRVVDPAVGSGAFPMAVLNKLVFILSKIDPENTFWKNSQIAGIKKSVSDPVIQRKLIEQIERQFQEKNADYGRKLYLIEKCIYGVDIQQIAVEIAKLRFFISLLVDEKIERDKPENNYGIEPLPNLGFKLMQGNSLISSFAGIDFDKTGEQKEDSLFDMDETNIELIKEFEELKNEYQNESDREKKNELRDKIEKAIFKIVEDKISPELRGIDKKYANVPPSTQRDESIDKEKQQIAKQFGFNDIKQMEKDLKAFTEGRKPKDFFLWKVYFAEVFSQKGGFDIVIGNPPWGAKLSAREKTLLKETFPTIDSSTPNSFAYFCGVGQKISSNSLTYILPDSILIKDYKKTRKMLLDGLIKISWFLNTGIPEDFKTFTYVEHDVCILFINNYNLSSKCLIEKSEYDPMARQMVIDRYELNKDEFIFPDQEYSYNLIIREKEISFYKQLSKLDNLGKAVQIHEGIHTGNARNLLFHKTMINKYCKPLYYGAKVGDKIENYLSKRAGWFVDYRKEIIKKEFGFYASLRDERIFTNPKLYISRTGNPFKVFYDKDYYASNNFFSLQLNNYKNNNEFVLKSILPIVLSRFTNYFIRTFAAPRLGSTFTETKIFHLLKIPLPKEIFNNVNLQELLISLVDKIISRKELGEDTKELEDKIDIMVYKLYELSYEEVKIVDPEFWLSKEEYEDFEIKEQGEII